MIKEHVWAWWDLLRVFVLERGNGQTRAIQEELCITWLVRWAVSEAIQEAKPGNEYFVYELLTKQSKFHWPGLAWLIS
jgi:hypothetical protein